MICAAWPEEQQKGSHAVLQGGHCRVGQPRVDVADFFEIKEPRRMVGIFEHIGRGLVNRHLTRTGCGVRFGSRMNLYRVKALFSIGHSILPFAYSL